MSLSIVAPVRREPHGEDLHRIRTAVMRAPLFQALPQMAVDDLIRRMQVRRANAHTTVVTQDEPGDNLFVIMSGRVKVVIFGENGREVTLSILRPGDAFGEMSLFDGRPRSATCVALEPTSLLALSRDDLLTHVATHPRTALNMLAEMA